MPVIDDLIRRYERLKSERSTWEHHWQEIAEIFQPRHAEFTTTRTRGEKRTQRVFDATPTLVPTRFASAMESLMTPRGALWHALKVADEDLMAFDPVKRWLDEVRKRMFRFRYHPASGFASNAAESYMNLGLYGTQVLYTEEGFDRAPIVYRSLPLGECFIAVNFVGQVDTLYRAYELTVRQAAQRWGAKALSDHSTKLLDDAAQADSKIRILSLVKPREEAGGARPAPGTAAMPFASYHIELDRRHMIAEGGYFEFPFHVSRFSQAVSEDYGRGPAMTVLPAAKMLNAQKRTVIRGAEKLVDPPLAIGNDGDMPRPNLNAGAINPGAVNDQGRAMIQPITTGARPDIGEELMQVERNAINDAFWVTLFQILVQNPQMTATEVLERSKEKAELVGPAIGKQETELLGPLIEREYGILARKGLLPPPPPELEGVALEVEYTSPMARMRRASEGVGILRTMETAAAAASHDPSVLDNFDIDAMVREVADINGVPPKVLRDPREVARLRRKRLEEMEAREQADQAAMAAQAVGQAAPAMKLLQGPEAGNA